MKEFERKQLLERIEREGATVGVSIPDRISIQGEEIALKEFVFESKRQETIPAGERDRIEQAKRNLRRERLERKQRLETEQLTFEEGEQVANSIIGIDRALAGLSQLEPEAIEAEMNATETADRKRWMNFLKQVLGNDSSSGTTGSRRKR